MKIWGAGDVTKICIPPERRKSKGQGAWGKGYKVSNIGWWKLRRCGVATLRDYKKVAGQKGRYFDLPTRIHVLQLSNRAERRKG